MNLQKSVKAAWIDFIICLFFGVYGVHKFREKKIGIGILYLLTFGLLCFGWLYDCAKLLVIAVCITLPHTKANGNNTKEQGEIWNHYYTLAKKIALIVVIIFLLFFFIAVACAPNNESTSIPTTESTTVPTTEPTTAPTTEPTTAPTTEPTTAPTTEPTTAPTTEPTTAPTTEPTTVPTTVPTTEPTTAPTTEPTTEPTTAPTTEPTTEPTTAPTTEPTTAPTTEPTTAPTTEPTTEPPHIHDFSPATCTKPKTCVCGATEGDANGHNWKDATYSAPKTCTACGITEGSPKDVPNKENYHGHVYTGGEKSTKYHYEADCAKKNSHEITWDEVERRGLGPCGTCVLK